MRMLLFSLLVSMYACPCVSDTRHILPRFDCKDFVVSVITGLPGNDCTSVSDSLRLSAVSGEFRANEPIFNYSSAAAL